MVTREKGRLGRTYKKRKSGMRKVPGSDTYYYPRGTSRAVRSTLSSFSKGSRPPNWARETQRFVEKSTGMKVRTPWRVRYGREKSTPKGDVSATTSVVFVKSKPKVAVVNIDPFLKKLPASKRRFLAHELVELSHVERGKRGGHAAGVRLEESDKLSRWAHAKTKKKKS